MAISQSGPATVVAGAAAMATLPKCEVGSAAAAAAAAAATASVTATAATAAAAAAAVAVAAVAAASISTPADALAGEASVEESASGVCETLADASSIDPNVWRIHGQDYDLSEFVKDHPGGVSAILLGKGVDCTNMFESYHVFNAPVKRLAKYALQPNGGVRRTESPFHAELRLLMREHFAGEPKWAHKAKWSHVMLVCVLGVLNGLAWIGWCAGSWLALALLPARAMVSGDTAVKEARLREAHASSSGGAEKKIAQLGQQLQQLLAEHVPAANDKQQQRQRLQCPCRLGLGRPTSPRPSGP